MFATFLATAQMHFFSAPSRPGLVFWLMVGSGTAWVLCMVLWLYFHFGTNSSVPYKPEQSITTGGGDNSGSQYRAKRDVNDSGLKVAGSVYGTDAIKALTIPSPPTPSLPKPSRLPTLDLSFAIGHVGADYDYFQFKEGGRYAIVVRVRNRPAPRGETAPHARDIFAQIDFDTSIGQSTVERAYWVDIDNNQITLAGGDEAWVLVGVPEASFLSSWHNRNTYSSRRREWSSPNFEPESRTIPWGQGELTGQIYIVSHNIRGNVTMEHSRFVLTREQWSGDFGKINMRFIDET